MWGPQGSLPLSGLSKRTAALKETGTFTWDKAADRKDVLPGASPGCATRCIPRMCCYPVHPQDALLPGAFSGLMTSSPQDGSVGASALSLLLLQSWSPLGLSSSSQLLDRKGCTHPNCKWLPVSPTGGTDIPDWIMAGTVQSKGPKGWQKKALPLVYFSLSQGLGRGGLGDEPDIL